VRVGLVAAAAAFDAAKTAIDTPTCWALLGLLVLLPRRGKGEEAAASVASRVARLGLEEAGVSMGATEMGGPRRSGEAGESRFLSKAVVLSC
jgi:hypothetical protein